MDTEHMHQGRKNQDHTYHTCACRAPAVRSPRPRVGPCPPHDPTMAALLHADRTADESSCSGPIERSMSIGIVMLPATRASSGRSVQWLRHTRRDVARHTFTCAQCRRHVDRRPWCSAGIAHGHARAVGARRHRLQSGWHTSAASLIHPWRPAWSPAGS